MRIALIGGVVLFGRLHRRRAPSVRLATSNSHGGGSTGTGYRHPVPEPVLGVEEVAARFIRSVVDVRSWLVTRCALRCVALRCVALRYVAYGYGSRVDAC
ncbi:hypothetical protein ACFE04_008319 [Oxalis oulophora]